MKKRLFILIFALATINMAGVDFDNHFNDKTLRIDYIFSGNAEKQYISLDGLCSIDGWAGRRVNLDSLPIEGDGNITMTSKQSGEIIYRMSFSSLFQEWICEDEAQHLTKGFENSFLVPMPKEAVQVTIQLKNKYHEITAELTHEVKPDDILIHDLTNSFATPYKYIWQGGSSKECIDVVIMAEGYTKEEMELFYTDAQKAVNAIFSHEPFTKYKNRFNFIAVASESRDSGVSIPRKGEWKETAVNSNFDTFYTARYLTTSHVKQIHNLLAKVPYEHIIILANTDTYGGGGIYNSYTLTTGHHAAFEPVVVHEFGHSFGALADEYAYDDAPSPVYPYSIEPWEKNITTMVDFESKWKDMPGTSLVEGGGYTKKGIYRAREDCRMNTNSAKDFCPVCQAAIEEMIRFYTEKL
ncbi:MAG: peptidase M64 [Bacteroidales bacterium]|nr:peptidase M64 [Bacteroidales bacterium]